MHQARRLARLVVATGRPENLAAFRISVAGALLLSRDLWDAPRWAALPKELRVAPTLGLTALSALPISPELAYAALGLTTFGALLGLLGIASRPALTVAAIGALYVLGIPQLYGQVTHVHHFVWFLALLAASPCADALSIEARRAPRPPRHPVAYALPLFAAWALVAVIFFFPGIWKLRESGIAWIASDNLRNQMHWKWAQAGFVPTLRIDRSPFLCRLGAGLVVAFELSFPFLLPFRRLRPISVVGAWLFHLATAVFLKVSFASLAVSYVMFFGWRRAARALGEPAPRRCVARATCRGVAPVAVVGAVLVLGSAIQGARGVVDDWPFACYPTFQKVVGAEMPTLAIDAMRSDGTVVALPAEPLEGGPRQRVWALAWSTLGAGHRPERLEAFWRAIEAHAEVRELARDAPTIRFTARWISVVPEDRGRVVHEELLGTVRR